MASCGITLRLSQSRKLSRLSCFKRLFVNTKVECSSARYLATEETEKKKEDIYIDGEEFRVLVIPGHTKVEKPREFQRERRKEVPPARYKSMRTDQDWTHSWPAAHTFKWSVVPFPVRQGAAHGEENDGISPGKYANAELMKIPNFLHLTPVHVKKQCAVLKQFCNPWPKGLETDEACQKHFPVEVVTRDYVVDGPSIRDPRSRKVSVKVSLSDMKLDYHARDKLLRLVGDRYDFKTNVLTIETDRCPLKKQNYDYALYLLTAVFHESWKTEAWEKDKAVEDMEKYDWEQMPSKRAVVNTVQRMKERAKESLKTGKTPDYLDRLASEASEEEVAGTAEAQACKAAVEDLHNDGENVQTLDKYKDSVMKLLLTKS